MEIDVWDGEKKDSVHSDVVEEKHRFKSHVPSILATHLLSQRSKIASADSDEAQPTSTVQLPSPWITNTTATRIEPRVLHGHTLTKEVSFRDVCIAIREAAFTIRQVYSVVNKSVDLISYAAIFLSLSVWRSMLEPSNKRLWLK